jgi:prepilin-type N-terminal cleavage/methylation domain-containing protein
MKSSKFAPPAPRHAFTLIELLIVVAIIAILAAIAVPNFLEAQTRAKVSRTLADMRSMATALEAYVVDNNNYPIAEAWAFSEEGQIRLTTPLAYITSLPVDVFRPNNFLYFSQSNPPSGGTVSGPGGTSRQTDTIFIQNAMGYQSLRSNVCPDCFKSDYARYRGLVGFNEFAPASLRTYPAEIGYQLRSLGPNRADSQVIPYDPTNGTISFGDIMRWGPSGESLRR